MFIQTARVTSIYTGLSLEVKERNRREKMGISPVFLFESSTMAHSFIGRDKEISDTQYLCTTTFSGQSDRHAACATAFDSILH